MGTLYRNGVPYIGSGGAGGVEVTQAEYDALPESEKLNGSIYFITDGSVSYPTASQMRYDNTESGIPSTSVQGAIDELKIEIGDTDISTIGDGTLSGAVSELNNGLPKFDAYVDISAVSQGGTFTVPKTGFYMIYANPNTSSGYTQAIIRKGIYTVGGVYTAGGALGTQMTYLEAGEEYTLITKNNIRNLYLYY